MKPATTLLRPTRPYSVSVEKRELLPFRVRLAETAQDIEKGVEIRAAAYARHIPGLGNALRKPEPDDLRPDALLLIAESKLDGVAVGSIRLQPNFNRPLTIESALTLPETHQGRRLAEARRLGVENGASGRMVMVALVKAAYEICHACDIDFALVGGRRSVAIMYRTMLFDDILNGETVSLPWAGDLPHNIFSMPIRDADRRWLTMGHSLYDFMARTEHPDIRIDYEQVLAAFGT